MLTSSVQSAPCATPEAANDMVGGLLLQAGKGQKIEILNTEVHEVDGLWIATAFFKIETLEEEQSPEEDVVRNEDNEERLGVETDRAGAVYWHDIHREAHEGEEPSAARGIPAEEGPDIHPEEFRADATGIVPSQDQIERERAQQEIETEQNRELLTEDASRLAEDLQKEFEQAEYAENVDQVAYIPNNDLRGSEKTFEERREEAEEELERRELEELERLRREAVPLNVADIPLEEPEPKPAG